MISLREVCITASDIWRCGEAPLGTFQQTGCMWASEAGHRFEWDPAKVGASVRGQGVSFARATTLFGDPLGLNRADPGHSLLAPVPDCYVCSHLSRRLLPELNRGGANAALSCEGSWRPSDRS